MLFSTLPGSFHRSTSVMSTPRSDTTEKTLVAASFSPAFPLFKEADLILESSDRILFATRAVHLRSVSSVFDDILSLPVKESQETEDGRALLKIEEEADIVGIFLRFAQRDRPGSRSALSPPKPDWSTILRLSTMFDKYDAPLLAQACLQSNLPRFIGNPWTNALPKSQTTPAPVEIFAVAVIHGLEDVAQQALRWHHLWGLGAAGYKSFQHREKSDLAKLSDSWRPYGLGDLPIELLARIAPKYIKQYRELHDKSLTHPGYSWLRAGDDFKL